MMEENGYGEEEMVVSSGNYEVIESGSAITFDESSNIVLKVKASWNFEFTIILEFNEDDGGGERNISINVDEQKKNIRYTCTNFGYGAGTAEPLEVGTAGLKKVFFHFWVERVSESKFIRSVQYTVFKER